MSDTTDTEVADEKHVRPFGEFLQDQRGGSLHAELGDLLNLLVEAVAEHGKAGTLSMTLKVKPAGKNGHTVTVEDDVKVKAPEGDRGDSIFFIDKDHNLRREDPRQQRLDLRTVDRDTGELRDINKTKEA